MNDLERIHQYRFTFPETTEEFSFSPEAAVYKVARKMFALLSPDAVPVKINLKCDPDRALKLRDEHSAIIPGYHMNKRHWNTLELDGSLSDSFVKELIEHSFSLVLAGHTRKVRDRISYESS